jgi:RNA polymerase sigma-70 factor (ECF subfamily)
MRALVDAAREGDQLALDDLVRATYGGTYTLAYRLTGNDDDARDVVQDAYLRAYRGLRRFRGDAQFTTWLYRITANCSANLLARRARHRTESLSDDEPIADPRPDIDPERRMAGSDDRARISSALAELPWRLRQVIVLRDIYDLAHSSIAKELGITEAAAKVRLHRARRRLRDVLAAHGFDGGGIRDDVHGQGDGVPAGSEGGVGTDGGVAPGGAGTDGGVAPGGVGTDDAQVAPGGVGTDDAQVAPGGAGTDDAHAG